MNKPDDSIAAAPAAEVALLWGRLLSLTEVPQDVNFLELGGDSLLLLSLLVEVEEHFGVYLSAEDILDDLTVRGFVAAIQRVGLPGRDPR